MNALPRFDEISDKPTARLNRMPATRRPTLTLRSTATPRVDAHQNAGRISVRTKGARAASSDTSRNHTSSSGAMSAYVSDRGGPARWFPG
ncbi:MAG: hypothetical protein ACLQNV_21195 [Steroidobacteraceae bacterium]